MNTAFSKSLGLAWVCLFAATSIAQTGLPGSVPQGSATQGSATQGSATQGSATQGSVAQGSATVGSGSASNQGSANAAIARANALPVAMNGYCSVCILDMKKWVKGSPNFAVVLDGKRYLFPGEAQRQTFLKNTTKYTPMLGGDCVVCLVDGKTRTPGTVYSSAIHQDRLYMFPSDKEKTAFMANPDRYQNADLAHGGMCGVCKVEMQKDVPGTAEFGTIYGGMRYYFPGLDQKKMFLANPTKYAVKPE